MNDYEQNIAKLIEEMIKDFYLAQSARIDAYWEPRIRGVLSNAADAVGHELRLYIALLAGVEASREVALILREQIPEIVADAAARQRERAVGLLVEMVSVEVTETLQAMTVNGLVEACPRLNLGEQVDGRMAKKLAGGAALESAVDNSVGQLCAKLTALIDDVIAGHGRTAVSDLERLIAWWRARLRTIANTVVHAVFNRVSLAVNSSFHA